MPSEFSLKTIIERMIQLKIITKNNCWELKHKHATKYSLIKCYGVEFKAHRISAAYHHNLDLNDDKSFACHKNECNNRACWNPDHIYVGNQQTNMVDRAATYIHPNSRKTCCPKCGLPFTPEGRNNWRHCRPCMLKKMEENRRRKGIKKKREYFIDKTIDPITGRRLKNDN